MSLTPPEVPPELRTCARCSNMRDLTEGERVRDRPHLVHIFRECRRYGFSIAIDDFGTGYAGLDLLSAFQPDVVKLDMALVRGIDCNRARQAVVKGVMTMCAAPSVRVLAEGVETPAERDWLAAEGVELMQGYLFGWPAFRGAAEIDDAAWA